MTSHNSHWLVWGAGYAGLLFVAPLLLVLLGGAPVSAIHVVLAGLGIGCLTMAAASLAATRACPCPECVPS